VIHPERGGPPGPPAQQLHREDARHGEHGHTPIVQLPLQKPVQAACPDVLIDFRCMTAKSLSVEIVLQFNDA
jgi:hypothetical protein